MTCSPPLRLSSILMFFCARAYLNNLPSRLTLYPYPVPQRPCHPPLSTPLVTTNPQVATYHFIIKPLQELNEAEGKGLLVEHAALQPLSVGSSSTMAAAGHAGHTPTREYKLFLVRHACVLVGQHGMGWSLVW